MSVPLFDPAGTAASAARRAPRGRRAACSTASSTSSARRSKAFERSSRAYVGAREAVGVANGTEAITIGLRALGVGPGDDVVVPSFSFYASAEAIPVTGARPVFCDVDPDTMVVTADTVKAALTPNTKAVVAVHLFGNVAPIAEIEALGVPVLEDAAQSAGSMADGETRPGALGTLATFSFYPSKNLGAFGDGGAITTDDRAARRAASACCASTAATTRSATRRSATTAASTSSRRRSCASSCRISTPGPTTAAPPASGTSTPAWATTSRCRVATDGARPAWHLYVVRRENADALIDELNAAGIQSRSYYRVADPRTAGDGGLPAGGRPAGNPRGRAHPSRASDQRGDHPRSGRRGHRGGRAEPSLSGRLRPMRASDSVPRMAYTSRNSPTSRTRPPKGGFGEMGEARFATGALDAAEHRPRLPRAATRTPAGFGHRHEKAEEINVVLSGSGRVRLDDELVDLRDDGRDPHRAAGHALLRGRSRRPRVARLRAAPRGRQRDRSRTSGPTRTSDAGPQGPGRG